MNHHNKHATAVLVFALSTGEEMRRKKMIKGERLFDALTEHTLRTVKKTGLPFFHFTEQQQDGDSFGERFTNAVQNVFDQGYDKIITIGNDSPHLTRAHFAETLSNLEADRSVIGPSADGGFYLLGLHRSDFNKVDFKDLSWQTFKLKGEISTLLCQSGKEITVLSTLLDIDTVWDAQIIGQNNAKLTRRVSEAIRLLTMLTQKVEPRSASVFEAHVLSIPHNKGSPDFTLSS